MHRKGPCHAAVHALAAGHSPHLCPACLLYSETTSMLSVPLSGFFCVLGPSSEEQQLILRSELTLLPCYPQTEVTEDWEQRLGAEQQPVCSDHKLRPKTCNLVTAGAGQAGNTWKWQVGPVFFICSGCGAWPCPVSPPKSWYPVWGWTLICQRHYGGYLHRNRQAPLPLLSRRVVPA